MLVRLSTATAVICILSGAALAQEAAKPTDPQIATSPIRRDNSI